MTGAGGAAASPVPPHPPRRRAPVSPVLAAALLALTAAVVVLLAMLAGNAGPLVAHPPNVPAPRPRPITRPAITLPTMPTAAPGEHGQLSDAWWWAILGIIGGLVVLLLIRWLVRMLRRPGRVVAPPMAAANAATSPVAMGWLAEDRPRESDEERVFDAHRAADEIVACWLAVEHAAAALGYARPAAATPTEFLDEAVARFGDVTAAVTGDGEGVAAVPASSALGLPGHAPRGGSWPASTVLLRLYQRARFDTAALAPGMAALARSSARAMIDRWTASAPRRAEPGSHR